MACMGLWPTDGSCVLTIIPLYSNTPQIMTRAVCWTLGGHGLLSKEMTENYSTLYQPGVVFGFLTKLGWVEECVHLQQQISIS